MTYIRSEPTVSATLASDYQDFADLIHNIATGSSLSAVAINAAGSGYAVGDRLFIAGGTRVHNLQAQIEVTSIGGGGTVTGIRIYSAGLYTVNPGTGQATSYITGTGGTGLTVDTTLTSNGWTALRATNVGGAGQREVILEGPGAGSDEIICGYRSFSDAGSGARNLCINAFTGFDSGLTYGNQPGRSPGLDTASSGADLGGSYALLTDASSFAWWVRITPRSIVGVAKVGTCYSSFGFGFINTFATTGEWPYPIFVAGTSSERFRTPGAGNISSSGICDPIADANGDIGPMQVRNPSGVWKSVQNSVDGSPRGAGTTDVKLFPGGDVSPTSLTGDDWYSNGQATLSQLIPRSGNPGTQSVRLVRTTNSGGDLVIRIPATLVVVSGTSPVGVYGEIDGVFWFDTAGTVVAENRFSDGSDRFTVFQSGVRSDNWSHWALREN